MRFSSKMGAGALAIALSVVVPMSAQAAVQADQTQNLSVIGSFGPMCQPPGMMFPFGMLNKDGSTFTAGVTGDLTTIEFPVIWTQTTANLTVNIWADSGGLPTGSALATQVLTSADLTPVASGGMLEVNFTTPAAVTAGTPYIFTFGFDSCSQSAQMSVGMVNAPSDKHRIWYQTGQSWAPDASHGMNFTTFVDVPAQNNNSSSSPTPSSSSTSSASSTLADTGQNQGWLWSLAGFGALLIAAGAQVVARKRHTR